MLGLLEMWIWEKEKHFLQLTLEKEVWQILHGIAPQASNVVVAACILKSQGLNPILDVVGNFDPDLHADHQLVREHG